MSSTPFALLGGCISAFAGWWLGDPFLVDEEGDFDCPAWSQIFTLTRLFVEQYDESPLW